MTIGEFSRLVGVTPSALRYYDDCGLLVPAHTAAGTGYRFYAPAQRDRGRVIRMLREAGLPLAEVRRIVDGPADDAPRIVRDHLARNAEEAKRSAVALHRALLTLLGSDEAYAQVRVSGPEFASGIRQVRHAADRTDRTEPVDLSAVQVEIDAGEVRLVTTDRYRLALRSLRGHGFEGGQARVGVDPDGLMELVPELLLADGVTLRVDRAGLTCVIGEQQHALAAVGGSVPDYRVVLDGILPADAKVVADRDGLRRALRPADRDRVVLLGAAGDGVGVTHPSTGDARTVAGTWLGPRFEVAFDAAHLDEALAVSVGPDVIIELADGPLPAVVRSADHGSFTTLVMPRVHPVQGPYVAGASRSG
jgi:DNA-binding transcriptional MerR regulator